MRAEHTLNGLLGPFAHHLHMSHVWETSKTNTKYVSVIKWGKQWNLVLLTFSTRVDFNVVDNLANSRLRVWENTNKKHTRDDFDGWHFKILYLDFEPSNP